MANCISPFAKDGMSFPCGKCYPCLRRRVSGWSFRLVKEGERSSSSFFVTFTYDTNNVPLTSKGFMTLEKTHYQLFMKLLRKVNAEKLKYFLAGEYGGKSYRPHYHSIMFNVELSTLVGDKIALQVKKGLIILDGRTPMECSFWPYGHITIGEVSEASIGYTLKYVMKPSRIPLHANDDRVPEFQLISKGLGSEYVTPAMKKWHKDDILNRFYLPLKDGKKIALPRYYKQKIYSKIQRESIGVHLQRTLEVPEITGRAEVVRSEYYQLKQNRSRLNETL